MARKIIAARIGYRDLAASPIADATLYLATDWVRDGSTIYEGRLSRDIRFGFQVAPPYTGQKPAAGIGDLTVRNEDGGVDEWFVSREFRDGAVTIKSLDVGEAWDDGVTLAVAVVEDITAIGENEVRLKLRDTSALLERPLAQETWEAGEFGDAEGKAQPVAFGTPLNVKPVPVIFEDFRFDCHDRNLVDIAEVRVDGEATTAYTVAGTELDAVSSGAILSSKPNGQVTIDPVATGTSNIAGFAPPSPPPADIIYSNAGRTMQSARRNYDSPLIYNYSQTAASTKQLADGGKWYFEVVPERVVQASNNYESIYGVFMGVGFGITAAIDGDEYIKKADTYSLACCNNPNGGYTHAETYGDDAVEDSFQSTGITGWGSSVGVYVGVQCDFDALTVQFFVYQNDVLEWTSSLIPITANSPLDSMTPFGSVAAPGSADIRSNDNKVTVYTQPENLQAPIPSGYEPWDESAYNAATKFSSLVESITDRISGITVDTASQDVVDGYGYAYSYYAQEGKSAAEVLWEACRSFTGWYYPNRTGALSFGRLAEPSGGVLTFNETNIIRVVRYELDRALGLSNRMGALRNWLLQDRDGLDDALSEAVLDQYSREYQYEVQDTESVLSPTYNHAKNAKLIGTYFRTTTDANTEVARLASLFTRDRYFLELDVAFKESEYAAITLGDSIRVDLSRLGLAGVDASGEFSTAFDSGFDITAGGKSFLILGISGNFKEPFMRLKVWG